MSKVTVYIKAILAALIACLGATTATLDVVPPWVAVTSSALVALGVVYRVPNAGADAGGE